MSPYSLLKLWQHTLVLPYGCRCSSHDNRPRTRRRPRPRTLGIKLVMKPRRPQKHILQSFQILGDNKPFEDEDDSLCHSSLKTTLQNHRQEERPAAAQRRL